MIVFDGSRNMFQVCVETFRLIKGDKKHSIFMRLRLFYFFVVFAKAPFRLMETRAGN